MSVLWGLWPAAREVDDGGDRDAWLAARRGVLTASRAAALTGDHPFVTADQYYLEKLGAGPAFRGSGPAWFGSMREEVNLEMFGARAGREVRPSRGLYVHRDLPWLAATPDAGLLGPAPTPPRFPLPPDLGPLELPPECEPGTPVETKATASKSRPYWKRHRPVGRPWNRTDRLFYYYAQVQWQLAVLGRPVGVLVGFVDAAEMYVHVIYRDAAYQRRLLEAGEAMARRLEAARSF